MRFKISVFVLVGAMLFISYGLISSQAGTGFFIQEDPEIILLKEKQMNTMNDIARLSIALLDYIKDHGVPPEQEGSYDEESKFFQELVSSYLETVPIMDAWGNGIQIFCGEAANGKYGITGCTSNDFVVVSFGRDGKMEKWEYDEEKPAAGYFTIKSADDFDKDLIMWNGSWIRAPQIIEQ
jgi:hypothetical protein